MSEEMDSKQWKSLNKKVDSLTESLTEIKQLLAGSSLGEKGLVWKVYDNHTRIEDIEHFKKKVYGIAIGLSVGGSAIVTTIINLLF